jgi:hypothetical protein
MATELPVLYVEGPDDTSVISALLKVHGCDTREGKQHLEIRKLSNLETLLKRMPDAIRSASERPIGFVLDTDVTMARRWQAVCGQLKIAGATTPKTCPRGGYFGQLKEYPFRFGVWLMPDCHTSHQKLENLIQSLLPPGHPLWTHAVDSTAKAATIVGQANRRVRRKQWNCFSKNDRIKAEVRTWLAWQEEPGAPMGTAIRSSILAANSPAALLFLRWLRELFNLTLSNVD